VGVKGLITDSAALTIDSAALTMDSAALTIDSAALSVVSANLFASQSTDHAARSVDCYATSDRPTAQRDPSIAQSRRWPSAGKLMRCCALWLWARCGRPFVARRCYMNVAINRVWAIQSRYVTSVPHRRTTPKTVRCPPSRCHFNVRTPQHSLYSAVCLDV